MESQAIVRSVREYGVWVVVGVVGLGILAYGLWSAIVPEEPMVEIVKGIESQNSNDGKVVVDVAGAVERPGLYTLTSGARVGDALVTAGGLAVSADREWVAQTINLAQALQDGQKIYIPNMNDNNPTSNSRLQTNQAGHININTANQSELETLDGIGESRARAIIDSRPYSSLEELVSKAKIPQSIYEKIKSNITLY